MSDNVKTIPYGVSDFTNMRRRNGYYVDNTWGIPLLEALRTKPGVLRPAAYEHPAGIWKREFKIVSNFSSWIDPIGALLAEHLEDDAAEVSAEGADGLIVLLAFGAFFLVVAL